MDIFDFMKNEKLRFLSLLREESRRKTLIIYGAGYIGQSLGRLLKNEQIPFGGFCVTDGRIKKEEEQGKPIYFLGDLKQNENIVFVVASKSALNQEMERILKENKIKNYIPAPKHLTQIVNNDSFRTRLDITAVAGCSIQCRFCPQAQFMQSYYSKKKRKTLPLEDFKSCVDKVPRDTIINFAGFVEPFLHENAVEMIQYAYNTGHEVELFTTLVGMTEKKFLQIKHIPFLRVVLHLPDKKGYARIPVTKEYLSLLRLVLETKKPSGVPFVDIANCQDEPHPEAFSLAQGKVSIAWDLIDRAGNLDDARLRSSCTKGPIYCDRSLALNHNVLLPDGSLALCCMDFGLKHILGNLLTESYEAIRAKDLLQDLKNKMAIGDTKQILCRNCVDAYPLDL